MDDKMLRIVRIEERLNRAQRLQNAAAKLDAARMRLLEESMRKRLQGMTASEYVLRRLPALGFALPDGQPDCVRFYHYAQINPDVWSTFLSGTHAPSTVTLMKLVVAMALDEEEARAFLQLSGAGFNLKDPVHQVLLACIECGYRDPESVYEVMEFYENVYAGKGKKFVSIYHERKKKTAQA